MSPSAYVSLVIPCRNEERCIAPTILWAKQIFLENNINGEIIVVDNCSTDNSAQVARNLGAIIVDAPKVGYGEALRAGFMHASHEFIVMVDADLSYPLSELPILVEGLKEGADLVIGNRLSGKIAQGAMPWLNRYVGTPFLSWLIRLIHKLPVYDCNSGFRAFRKSILNRTSFSASGMELASEMLIKAAKNNLTYLEVPIPFHRDQRGTISHLNRWRDGFRHLKTILSYPEA